VSLNSSLTPAVPDHGHILLRMDNGEKKKGGNGTAASARIVRDEAAT
jgi:hypothetical protein